jgi:hypothetical protein
MNMMLILFALVSNLLFQSTSPFELTNKLTPASEANTDVYPFENLLLKIGYKEVNKALQESKDYFKSDIPLPTQLPPVTFTHNFGRFNHSFGKANDEFEITYLNENLGQNHYQIRVKPVKYKLEFSEEKIDQTIKLSDGSESIYST